MALFGFGKKKKGGDGGSEGAPAPQKSTVKKIRPKSSVSGKLSKVKRPSVAVRPSAKKVESARLAAAANKAQEEAASGRKVRKSTKGKQLGQLLLKQGKITEAHLEKALDKQMADGGLLGQILVGMEVCSKADVAGCLKKQRTITTVNLDKTNFDKEALALVTREFCEKNRLIPFELVGNQLCLAMSNALDTMAKNEIRDLTQMHIKIFDSAFEDIQQAIEKYMDGNADDSPASLADALIKEEQASAENIVIEVPDEPEVAVIEDVDTDAAVIEELDVIEEIEEVPAIEPADEIEEIAEIEEIEEIAEEPAEEEIPLIEDVPELAAPSLDDENKHAGEIPSVAAYEDLDVIEIDDAPSAPPLPEGLLEGQRLAAIGVDSGYADEVIVEGKVSVLKRWEKEVCSESGAPAQLKLKK